MNWEDIKELINRDIDKAFDELDDIFGTSNGAYNDLTQEYYSRPENFNMATFRSKLKRCARSHFQNCENIPVANNGTFSEHRQEPKATKSLQLNKNIREESIFLCDRDNQFNTFLNALQDQKKINTFYIHGDEMHGHEAMFNRFCENLRGSIREHNRKKVQKITGGLADFASLNCKEKLMEGMLDAFDIGLDQYPSYVEMKKEKLSNIYKHSNYTKTLKANDIVAVNFRILSSKWFPGLANEIEWFVNSFCDTEMLRDDAPTFHFFFSVVYRSKLPKIQQKEIKQSLFTSLFSRKKTKQQTEAEQIERLKQKKQNIIKELKKTFIPDIDELTLVTWDDVDKWLFSINIPPYKREELRITKFKTENPQGYYMGELTSLFKEIIDHVNNKL